MCLVLFALEAHPHDRLVVAANRDEYYDRPARAAHWWDDAPGVLAGRDLEGGGTWLGVTRAGRFAALTNFRGAPPVAGATTRGTLAAGFLSGAMDPASYARWVESEGPRYQGFSLLVGDASGMWVVSNRDRAREVTPGVHGLGNHLLDTPWPKVVRGTAALADALLLPPDQREEKMFDALADREPPPDGAYPTLGAPAAFERVLAAPFIHSPERRYGTRCTTLLSIGHDGSVRLRERTWDDRPCAVSEVVHEARAP